MRNNFLAKTNLQMCPLCVKPPDRNQEIGQDLRYTFLNSSWHTDAKKIPEKLVYRRHLACFFQKKKKFGCHQFLDLPDEFKPKNFFEKFCFEKIMLGGAGRSTFQVFF